MSHCEKEIAIYTLIITSADTDRGNFPTPDTIGSYLNLHRAQTEMERWIRSQKEQLDTRYDTIERDSSHWEAYQDGYGAACYVRIDLVSTALDVTS